MEHHIHINDQELRSRIRKKEIVLGGNRILKIYGMLNCSSGKKLYKKNRVFFGSLSDAIQAGYRPCGHCMRKEYKQWKDGLI